ncbi:MutS-related protein [Candidatus Cardinium hertigii]|uniref:DNA mismatch repair protein MutS n=1 Tax=Candidatus Cardinium hertigii TaxID=247481 RepID=A0A2Z3LHK6_9BACT|nr:hypothetical protein [Candidatus Cardinium hertigii]AWN81985.1 DNA mismatch repair protein MutS [Candidatus Cardinium hertigii]
MKHNSKGNITGMLYVLLFYCIGLDELSATRSIQDEKLMTKIAYNYLRSFATAQKTAPTHPLIASVQQPTKQKQLPLGEVTLAESTQRKVVLRTLFADLAINQIATDKDLLNHNAWLDLALFCGTSSNPSHHLLASINKTTTVLGECALATLLATPTSDLSILLNRQEMVKLLVEQPDYLKALQEVLVSYRKVEPRLLSFWTSTDPLYTKECRSYMQNHFISDNIAINKNAAKLNKRITLRNFRDIYAEYVLIPAIGVVFCGSHALMTSFTKGGFVQSDLKSSFASLPFFVPLYSIVDVTRNYLRTDGKPQLWPFLGSAVMHGLATWRVFRSIKRYQEYSTVFRNLATRLQDVQCLLQTMQSLNNIVINNPALETVYGSSLKEIRQLLLTSQTKTELGTMVSNLLNIKFDNWPYIMGNGGKLLATFHLFEAYKNHLQPAMYALGKLDSLASIAMVIAHAHAKHPKHSYTFTKFLNRTQKESPSIQFHGMWNPLLNPETVVDNEVEMNANETRNMVLCGPNAGGKSSFLSGVAINLLLSQTFGIAASKQATITPFNKIITYIGVGDDIANGSSLFMVEMDRMHHYIHMLASSKPNTFIFSAMDELFSATNPVEGAAAAYSTIACIAKYSNALHIVSSHYPMVMGLESKIKGCGIRNFKVFVKEERTDGKNKKLQYTYKIVPGAATQAVALQLLEQEGYDKTVLNQARYMVQYPERFHNSLRKVK